MYFLVKTASKCSIAFIKFIRFFLYNISNLDKQGFNHTIHPFVKLVIPYFSNS